MRNTFIRMRPNLDNMVVQTNFPTDHQLLCVECGWEGSVVRRVAAEPTFKLHSCRLVSQMEATGD